MYRPPEAMGSLPIVNPPESRPVSASRYRPVRCCHAPTEMTFASHPSPTVTAAIPMRRAEPTTNTNMDSSEHFLRATKAILRGRTIAQLYHRGTRFEFLRDGGGSRRVRSNPQISFDPDRKNLEARGGEAWPKWSAAAPVLRAIGTMMLKTDARRKRHSSAARLVGFVVSHLH